LNGEDTDRAVDFGYLEGFAAGDAGVISEVLNLFQEQAAAWRARLSPDDPACADVLHTIKGTSRGVGAGRLAAASEAAEADPARLPEVVVALEATLAEMAAYQAR
jgi:hypothetical protein